MNTEINFTCASDHLCEAERIAAQIAELGFMISVMPNANYEPDLDAVGRLVNNAANLLSESIKNAASIVDAARTQKTQEA